MEFKSINMYVLFCDDKLQPLCKTISFNRNFEEVIKNDLFRSEVYDYIKRINSIPVRIGSIILLESGVIVVDRSDDNMISCLLPDYLLKVLLSLQKSTYNSENIIYINSPIMTCNEVKEYRNQIRINIVSGGSANKTLLYH